MIAYGFEKNKDFTVVKNGDGTVLKNENGRNKNLNTPTFERIKDYK